MNAEKFSEDPVQVTLVPLPEKLTPGMKIKSKRGSGALIVVTRDRNRAGQQLYRLRYIHGKYQVPSSTLWTRDDLVKSGCRLVLNREEAQSTADALRNAFPEDSTEQLLTWINGTSALLSAEFVNERGPVEGYERILEIQYETWSSLLNVTLLILGEERASEAIAKATKGAVVRTSLDKKPAGPEIKEFMFEKGLTGIDYSDALDHARRRVDAKYDPMKVLKEEFGITDPKYVPDLRKVLKPWGT